ncbi:hypothetical protein [Sphingomonas jeddahensis]|uniref:Uncharacterized protein n=1 Tax=Sphingomonas jeddahensis TaxID=1915074 RepID=A0A1V2ESB6_9SPHN|nr:hypothetical protein [Sphingomonas jeddahensis]ONF95561.1 hypothetical protein SPHI_22280 [Sphingomonas jeddahensis]
MAKALISFALAAMAGAAAVSAASAADDRRPGPYERQRIQLEKELSRLTPQPQVDCIDTRFRNVSLRAIGNKLIYRESRKRIYVSETAGGCENVARGDALVTRQFGPRLCRGDIATTVDRVARFQTGTCAIGPFTPYTAG